MKRLAALSMFGAMALMAGCNAGGIEFNGQQGVNQINIIGPIPHYNLPVEITLNEQNPTTSELWLGDKNNVYTLPTSYTGLTPGAFIQRTPTAGGYTYDIWSLSFGGASTDNPTSSTTSPVDDWVYLFSNPGATSGIDGAALAAQNTASPDENGIAAWVLSFCNQYYLRGVDGTELAPAVAGQPPVSYAGYGFASLDISIENYSATNPVQPSSLGSSVQQEIGDPTKTASNGYPYVLAATANVLHFQYNGGTTSNTAPSGLTSGGWSETRGENRYVELNFGWSDVVPYFDRAGEDGMGLGVYSWRYTDKWISAHSNYYDQLDGTHYCYFLAVVASHVIGQGVGVGSSGFTQELDQVFIMAQNANQDVSAFLAAGAQFEHRVGDLLLMQDVVNGTYSAPGSNSTLPGGGRRP